MDGSRLMGLAMFVPIIGLPQGHGNRKTIKTIPYVPLNTNNVLSCHQQLKQGSFFLSIDLATLPTDLHIIHSVFLFEIIFHLSKLGKSGVKHPHLQ